MKISACLALCVGLLFAAPMASAQEAMRAVGQLTYTPEPVELQTGVICLRPEDRMIRSMRIEARGGTADIQSVRLIYRDGETERYRIRERLRPGQTTGLIRKQGRGPLREVEVNYIPQGAVTLVLRADAGLAATAAARGVDRAGLQDGELPHRPRRDQCRGGGFLPGAAPALHRL